VLLGGFCGRLAEAHLMQAAPSGGTARGCSTGQPGYGVCRWLHPCAKIFTIFEGTSEIQRMIIGRAVTGLDVRW